MKNIASLGIAVGVTALRPPAADARTRVEVDHDQVNEALPGWTVTITGEGTPEWRVVADDSAASQPQLHL